MKKIIVPYSFVIFAFFSCDLLDNNVSPDDEKPSDRISLPAGKTSSTDIWSYCDGVNIDLSKYEIIDSIVFVPNLRSQATEKKCIADLFNYSSNSAINGSEVKSIVNYTLHSVRSRNLVNSIPRTTNTLGIRFKSSVEGHFVEIGVRSFIIIYYR